MLINGDLDFLHALLHLMLLLDQPGHREYAHTGILQWTWDREATKLINNTYSKLGFKEIGEMTDT